MPGSTTMPSLSRRRRHVRHGCSKHRPSLRHIPSPSMRLRYTAPGTAGKRPTSHRHSHTVSTQSPNVTTRGTRLLQQSSTDGCCTYDATQPHCESVHAVPNGGLIQAECSGLTQLLEAASAMQSRHAVGLLAGTGLYPAAHAYEQESPTQTAFDGGALRSESAGQPSHTFFSPFQEKPGMHRRPHEASALVVHSDPGGLVFGQHPGGSA
mmetsp:Transcript_38016/g.89861  ORF Transcript_38016/g.89861 Transcript_38016/m.89861 type:complete len:209 (+) Transcript_38016:1934-2560(+)